MNNEQLRTLDERMALEVMGGHGEINYDTPIWAWTLNDGTKYWLARCIWQPTKDDTQALKCLDKIVDRGWMATVVSYAICKGVPVRKYSCNIKTQSLLASDYYSFGGRLFHSRSLAIIDAIVELLDS